MQNNVSSNTLLANLTTPSKNTGRDAASARKDTQESGVNFREAMDKMTRLKVDARRDQLAARANKQEELRAHKLEERRTDQQLKKASASDRTATAAQKPLQEQRVAHEQRSDQPGSTKPLQEKSSTNTNTNTNTNGSAPTVTDAVNAPAADNTTPTASVTEEPQAVNPNADLASALGIEHLEPAADTLVIDDPEAESVLLGEVDEAI